MPQDDATLSAGSAGSVRPFAWAVMTGDRVYDIYDNAGEAVAICLWLRDEENDGSWVTVPLYPHQPQPKLTDAEREAVETADAYMSAAGCHNTNVQKTLRGLLERTSHDAVPEAKAEESMKEPNGSSTGEPGGEPESTFRTGDTPSEAEIDALEYVVVNGHTASVGDYGILRQWLIRLRPEFDSAEAIEEDDSDRSQPIANGPDADSRVWETPAKTNYAAPPTWQEEVAAVEEAFERSGVKPTWPADEAGNIGPMAAAMADEIERLRQFDRPQPIKTAEDTPDTHATPTEGSVQGEGTDTVGQRLVERLSITQAMLDDNERLRAEIDRLREAIRRLAEQDATLSVQGGNVIVTMDATLTDAEREAVEIAINWLEPDSQVADELRGLLERLRTQKHKASRRAQRHVPETYFKSNEKRVDCDTNRDTAEPRNGALCEPVAWAAWFDDARGPIGWAVVLPDGGAYERCDFRWEAQAIADALPANEGVTATVVPLYPQPSLTDAEREAVEVAALEADAHQHTERAATLRGLLERLK